MQVIVDDNSSSWTVIEVDPQAVAELDPQETASIVVAEPALPLSPTFTNRLGSGSRLLMQTAVVLGSALAVGLGVFFLIGAVAGPDDEPETPSPSDAINDLAIEPGPAAPDNSSRSGSRRTEANESGSDRADGLLVSTASTLEVAGITDDSADDADDDGSLGTANSTSSTSGASTTEPTSTTSSSTSSPSTTSPTTSTPTTTKTTPTSTATSEPVTTSRLTTSTTVETTATTRPTSTQRTTTTVVTQPTTVITQPTTVITRPTTSTTRLTTTIVVVTTPITVTLPTSLPPILIAAPANNSELSWEAEHIFTANRVPGATRYCWTITANGDEKRRCSGSRNYRHVAKALDPGPTLIEAEALGAAGESLLSQRVKAQILATDVLTSPDQGDSIDIDHRISLQSRAINTADNYCWVVSQGSNSTGGFCDDDRRVSINKDFLDDAGIGEGPARIVAKAYRGNVLIGRHSIDITFKD